MKSRAVVGGHMVFYRSVKCNGVLARVALTFSYSTTVMPHILGHLMVVSVILTSACLFIHKKKHQELEVEIFFLYIQWLLIKSYFLSIGKNEILLPYN